MNKLKLNHMKRIFLILLCVIFAMSTSAIEPQDTNSQLQQLRNSVSALSKQVNNLKQENAQLRTKLNRISNTIKEYDCRFEATDSLINKNQSDIDKTAKEFGVKLNNTDSKTAEVADNLSSKTQVGVVAIIILLVIVVVVYYILHNKIRKGNDDITAMKDKADELNEKIVSHFSDEVGELQKVSFSLSTISKAYLDKNEEKGEQELIKTLADRITFMEMTLFRMDKNVRGYKQLTRSISQMKDNLLANGYEIVDMLGKPYNQGMKVTANFVEDETLEPGQQIITGIIKPQINYKGKMIQAAQITVSQNL